MKLNVEQLRYFRAFSDLHTDQLALVAEVVDVRACESGTTLLELGSDDPYSYFLLAGRVLLLSEDGRRLQVEAGTDRGRNPLSDLKPRKYAVKAIGPVVYLRIASDLLRSLSAKKRTSDDVLVQAVDHPTELRSAVELLHDRIRHDLETDALKIPSLPEVATRIGQILHKASTNARQVANIVATDPAMAAKVIKVANSPVYGGVSPVASLADAVMRLGFQMTHNLVISHALKELYKARSKRVRVRMYKLWRHSVRTAAFCFVAAGITRRFNPDHALLGGLLHDIGLVPVYGYLDEALELMDSELEIEELTERLRAPVGAGILRAWSFSDDIVNACIEAELWGRDPGPEPDLADLVVLAQLYGFIGSNEIQGKPALDEVPAFRKLFGTAMTPHNSIKMLRRVQERVEAVERMLKV